MSSRLVDATIADWLREGPERGPRHGLERALAATRRVDQRPGWSFPRWWLPRPIAGVDLHVPRLAGAGLLLLVSLLLLALLAIAFSGSRPRGPFGPAGERLIAFQDGTSIAVARVDGGGLRSISGGVPFARSPSFSPDGSRVAFVAPATADALGGRLVVVAVDGTGPPVTVSRRVEVVGSPVSQVAWSADGRMLAFAGEDGGGSRIFVATADGGSLVAVTDDSAIRDLPTWSPDGEWIAFREKDRDGLRTRLRMTRPDGSEVQEVTLVIGADAVLSKLRWSSGHGPLSYAYSPGFGVATSVYIDLGFQHNNQPWTDGVGGFVDHGIPWSPDGSRLAFLTSMGDLIVADNDATEPYDGHLRRLGRLLDCWVEWAPDGSALYGGSPGDCSETILVPLSDLTATYRLPGSPSTVASWQPLAP